MSSFRRRLQSVIETAESQTTKWAERFAANPADAFEWADDALQAAARLELARGVLAAMDRPENPLSEEGLRDYLTSQVLAKARYSERSSSRTSNMMARERLAAMAELLDQLSGGF